MKKNKQEPENQKLTTKLAPFLYLTAAINGGVILIVEILGAKMLSPFFGTSHFVWTAQITAVICAVQTKCEVPKKGESIFAPKISTIRMTPPLMAAVK